MESKAKDSSPLFSRFKTIMKTTVIALVVNLALATFKTVIGIADGSIAIEVDALNNFSDALSTIFIIIAMLLSQKKPDAKHPYGYGRFEYIAAIFVAVGVLLVGVQALFDSIDRAINPRAPHFDILTIVVIIVAIAVKAFMSVFLGRQGKKTKSEALNAASTDAKGDVLLTLGTLIVAIVGIASEVDIDGIVGTIISLAVIKIAIDTLRDAIGPFLGNKVDPELAYRVTQYVMDHYPEVSGVYDISIVDFGPENTYGTFHIELPDTLSARDVSELTRKMSRALLDEFNVTFSIAFYVSNADKLDNRDCQRVLELAAAHREVRNVHALFIDPIKKTISFDVVIDFDADGAGVIQSIIQEVSAEYPEYAIDVIKDVDYSA